MSTNKILWRVINCKIHEKRLEEFRLKANQAELPRVQRVACINGKKFTDRTFCSMIKNGTLDKRAELKPTEIAICLSHAKCWKQLVNSKSKYMVVFEDDCRPYKSFMKHFNAVMDASLGWDIFWLYNGNWERTQTHMKKMATVNSSITVYRETKPYNASGSAYIITREWAQVLLDKMFPIFHAVDSFMGDVRIKTGKHYSIKNKRRRNASFDCFTESPFMYVSCPSESTTTQTYHSTAVSKRRLKCK